MIAQKNIRIALPVTIWLVLLLLVPLILPKYFLHLLIITHICLVFALSWDLLAGYVGELSLGHSVFFGLSAYSAGYMSGVFHLNPWLSILISCFVAVVGGVLIGVPCLRLRGPYLGIVTLAFQMVLYLLAQSLYDFTGGEEGIRGIQRLFNSTLANYYFSILLVVIAITISYLLINSKYGLIFRAIRENVDASEAAGVNPVIYKMVGYIVSALLAGLAGGFQAHYLRIVTPDDISLALTFSAITMVAIGGKGTLIGAIVGAYVVQFIFDQLHILMDYRMLLYSIALIMVIRFFPNGLVGGFNRIWSRFAVAGLEKAAHSMSIRKGEKV